MFIGNPVSGFGDFISYLDSFGILGLFVFLAWAFYSERVRFGKDFDDLETKLDSCQAENRKLWEEKVAEKEKAADLAQAYLKIREGER